VNLLDARRRAPRVSVDGLCGVASNNDLYHASMSDLSTLGLRLERPFDPKNAKPIVQLEIELPGIDEVVWASAAVTHAFLTPMGRTADGQPRFWCKAGLRIADASRAERTMLRDYVVETIRAQRHVADRRDYADIERRGVKAPVKTVAPSPAVPARQSGWQSLRSSAT
jgi:hypothetical protein